MKSWLGDEICVFVDGGSRKFGQCCENEISIVKEFVRLNMLNFLRFISSTCINLPFHQKSYFMKIYLSSKIPYLKMMLL